MHCPRRDLLDKRGSSLPSEAIDGGDQRWVSEVLGEHVVAVLPFSRKKSMSRRHVRRITSWAICGTPHCNPSYLAKCALLSKQQCSREYQHLAQEGFECHSPVRARPMYGFARAIRSSSLGHTAYACRSVFEFRVRPSRSRSRIAVLLMLRHASDALRSIG